MASGVNYLQNIAGGVLGAALFLGIGSPLFNPKADSNPSIVPPSKAMRSTAKIGIHEISEARKAKNAQGEEEFILSGNHFSGREFVFTGAISGYETSSCLRLAKKAIYKKPKSKRNVFFLAINGK